METETITVDPLAKAKKLLFTDLTRAGKAGLLCRGVNGVRPPKGLTAYFDGRSNGQIAPAPDSQNPFRFLIPRSSEKPSKMDGNS